MILEPLDNDRVQKIREELEKNPKYSISPEKCQKFIPGVAIRRMAVIHLTKLNGTPFILNAELIETLEATPDTVISLVSGRKYVVKESVDDIRQQYIELKQQFYNRSGIKTNE
jgi:flagellar protein FlbD